MTGFVTFATDTFSPRRPGKQKLQGKANSRKSKSPNPGQAYAGGGERPSSVSSVHSEGDYHRQAPAWTWEAPPSPTGYPAPLYLPPPPPPLPTDLVPLYTCVPAPFCPPLYPPHPLRL